MANKMLFDDTRALRREQREARIARKRARRDARTLKYQRLEMPVDLGAQGTGDTTSTEWTPEQEAGTALAEWRSNPRRRRMSSRPRLRQRRLRPSPSHPFQSRPRPTRSQPSKMIEVGSEQAGAARAASATSSSSSRAATSS